MRLYVCKRILPLETRSLDLSSNSQASVDLHLISFLARVVDICGGQAEENGIFEMEAAIGSGFKVGPKIQNYWLKWVHRQSFCEV